MRQAAARLGVSKAAVHSWIYQQRWISLVRIGERCVRIPSDKLEEFIERHTIPSREEDSDGGKTSTGIGLGDGPSTVPELAHEIFYQVFRQVPERMEEQQ